MNAVVNNLDPVDTVFLLQVRVKTRFNVLNDRFPTIKNSVNAFQSLIRDTHLSSLLTKSPKPGVSTTVR